MHSNRHSDGVDLDWEYPVNNGAEYKNKDGTPKKDRDDEIDAYIELMRLIRAMKPDIILSVAVPGIPGDTLAFTEESVGHMDKCLDFWNVMSYDLVNRRSTVSGHHSGGAVIKETVRMYHEDKGIEPKKLYVVF